jgi:hypothetical protein
MRAYNGQQESSIGKFLTGSFLEFDHTETSTRTCLQVRRYNLKTQSHLVHVIQNKNEQYVSTHRSRWYRQLRICFRNSRVRFDLETKVHVLDLSIRIPSVSKNAIRR